MRVGFMCVVCVFMWGVVCGCMWYVCVVCVGGEICVPLNTSLWTRHHTKSGMCVVCGVGVCVWSVCVWGGAECVWCVVCVWYLCGVCGVWCVLGGDICMCAT